MNERQDSLKRTIWDEDFARAREAAKLGRLGEAAHGLNNLLARAKELFGETDFRTLESVRSLAESLWEMGDYAQSRALARRILSLRPATAQTIVSAGRILRYQEQNAEAAAVLERGASSFPEESDFYLELGRVYDRSGRFEDAARCLTRARDLAPEKKHVWSELAQSLFHASRFEEALALGPQASRRGVSSPELDMQRGLAMIASGSIAEGQALIASASDAGAYDQGYRTFASRFRDSGRSSEAEPLHLESWRNSQGIDAPRRDFEAARLTCVFMGQKKWDEGERVAHAALEDMKNNGRHDYAWVCQISQFADILLGTDRHDEAEGLYRDSLEFAEKIGAARSVRSKLLWGLARVNQTRNHRGKALDFIHQACALRDQPFGDDHIYEIQSLHENAATLLALDRLDEAADLLGRLSAMAQRRPFNTRVILGHALLGQIRFRQGRHEEARLLFSRVLDLREKILYQIPIYTALSGMARLHIESGQLSEAEKLLLAFRNDPAINRLTELAQAQQNPNPSGLVEILRLLFEIAARRGEFPSALAYGTQAIRAARAQRDAQKYEQSFSYLQKIAEASSRHSRNGGA